MTAHAEIILGLSGQVLFYDPPEAARPSSPACTVYGAYADDGGGAVAATSGAASVDSVNTTISAAAYPGDQTLTLTSGTGIARNRRYLLTAASGVSEIVELAGIAGTTATLRMPLVNEYASGATFQGTRISIAVDNTWAATASNLTDALADPDDIRFASVTSVAPGAAGYRVRWTYTADGASQLGVSYFDLVRYQAKSIVTPLAVDRLFPGWIDRLPPDYRIDQGSALIDEAFLAVKLDALGDSQLLRRIRDTQVLADLVKHRANLLAMQNDVMAGRRDSSAFQLAQDLYDRRYTQLIREPKVSVDQGGGGAHGEAIRQPAFRR